VRKTLTIAALAVLALVVRRYLAVRTALAEVAPELRSWLLPFI
jgi:hypothetical protein